MEILIIKGVFAHFLGDYYLQSGWMANGKSKQTLPAAIHALAYSMPFILLCSPSVLAWCVIAVTHFVIDRWRLAKYIVFAKEHL